MKEKIIFLFCSMVTFFLLVIIFDSHSLTHIAYVRASRLWRSRLLVTFNVTGSDYLSVCCKHMRR